jgi:phospholipid transport system substrate-binding protein
MISRRFMCLAVFLMAMINAPPGGAQVGPPDALVKRVSTDVLAAVNADPSIQAGDVNKIVALVDVKVLPFLDFERMTATAVGPRWREATPDQQKALQEEFQTLLVRVYSGALAQAKDRTIELRPMRDAATNPEVVVRTVIRGRGDPLELDFRLENSGSSWRIYDLNVGGVWLVEIYRGSFAQAIAAGGIDGLIAALSAKNKATARN